VEEGKHSLASACLSCDTKKLKVVWKWPLLIDKHNLRSFLHLCTCYRKFTAQSVDIAKPLTQFTEEKWISQWSPEEKAAFWSMEESLCMAPILGYAQMGERFISDTQATWGLQAHCHKGRRARRPYYSGSSDLCGLPAAEWHYKDRLLPTMKY
jgi:hypothetical protein